ncbi:Hypothetical predicted protein [Cloeon dipterum]|uniref:Uncharacterized protein n=1 Tax=Cloeon dipterum TaxID=197152 RepID=A0A8S1DVZ8_9INSE|nr:Hypothetical predicted protein [Cloeon dipterum]
MNFSGISPFVACVLIVFQVCDCARAPQQRTKITSTASTCPEPPPSLVMAHNHCKKMQDHAMDTMGNKNSSDVVTTMNSTDADMMKMLKCYPLCLLKALTLVDENMVPMESKMKTMMTTVALITDPKSKEMMSNLIENCLKEYNPMAMNGEHNQQEAHSCMATGMDHSGHMKDKCLGAANLMSCINKGLPCPIFDDMKMMK